MKKAKFTSKEQFLQVDNKIVEYRNKTTNDSYLKSGTLFEYYNESIEPDKDGCYYIPATKELIEAGIFENIEIVENE